MRRKAPPFRLEMTRLRLTARTPSPASRLGWDETYAAYTLSAAVVARTAQAKADRDVTRKTLPSMPIPARGSQFLGKRFSVLLRPPWPKDTVATGNWSCGARGSKARLAMRLEARIVARLGPQLSRSR